MSRRTNKAIHGAPNRGLDIDQFQQLPPCQIRRDRSGSGQAISYFRGIGHYEKSTEGSGRVLDRRVLSEEELAEREARILIYSERVSLGLDIYTGEVL